MFKYDSSVFYLFFWGGCLGLFCRNCCGVLEGIRGGKDGFEQLKNIRIHTLMCVMCVCVF